MTPAPRTDPETSIERTVDSEMVEPGESTTVTINVRIGTDAEFFALHEGFSPSAASATVVSLTLDGSPWESAVNVPAPDAVSAFYDAESGSDLVAGSEIELVYELTVPDHTDDHELSGLLALVEAGETGEELRFHVPDETLFVGEGIERYADEDDIIRASGLNQAVQDYLGGDLPAGLLNDVIQAYLTGEPVA